MATEVYKLGSSRLTAQLSTHDRTLVVALQGRIDATARETLAEVGEQIHRHRGDLTVFDLERLRDVVGSGAGAFVRLVRECRRLEQRVALVRCPEAVFQQMREAGLGGGVEHVPSVAAATDGLFQDGVQTIRLHFQSQARSLTTVRRILRAVTRRAGLSEMAQDEVLMGVVEACTNAILHGSPVGGAGRISLCIHLGAECLIIDVADEGGGFVPGEARLPDLEEPAEHGYGLFIIRRVMDRLEVFPGERGTVVRMTKMLHPGMETAIRNGEVATAGSMR
jgi:serine/threonine-protein kinase RsbW